MHTSQVAWGNLRLVFPVKLAIDEFFKQEVDEVGTKSFKFIFDCEHI